ncbi:lipid-binding protein [Pseudozobellia thermophila]|uniref:Lipid-binding putative hydrolase n=1 Tax=Pseudozobellia thermophila TaxID=192903 RepID=A0A1M6HP68_9FLAO|nr:lipid-binding protein [Pseudozobellia thermophila]SHJ23995.1 Lipid-binding putative hydrolase [Pseudozobellia thermophila]
MRDLFKTLTVAIALIALSSCDEGGDFDPGATQVVEMSGDWFVQTFVGDVLVLDYSQISTYNTAADDGTEIWVDDHGNIWDFKVKSPVDLQQLTFSGSDLTSVVEDYNITVSISNGTITKDGATTTGGNTADQISFDVEFSDDPGTIYTMIGYKRNGLLEDEH